MEIKGGETAPEICAAQRRTLWKRTLPIHHQAEIERKEFENMFALRVSTPAEMNPSAGNKNE